MVKLFPFFNFNLIFPIFFWILDPYLSFLRFSHSNLSYSFESCVDFDGEEYWKIVCVAL